jgi:hypothetical protein
MRPSRAHARGFHCAGTARQPMSYSNPAMCPTTSCAPIGLTSASAKSRATARPPAHRLARSTDPLPLPLGYKGVSLEEEVHEWPPAVSASRSCVLTRLRVFTAPPGSSHKRRGVYTSPSDTASTFFQCPSHTASASFQWPSAWPQTLQSPNLLSRLARDSGLVIRLEGKRAKAVPGFP